MHIIQKWFERLAGITQDELDRIHLATEVFRGEPRIDLAQLHMPACWRRPARLR